jgi:uncharacterized protein
MRFAGYAAIFDAPDKGGDIVRKGAFRSARPGLPLFWQHDPARAIGTVDHVAEDARGLRVIGQVTSGEVKPGQGLSFGYRVRRSIQGTFRELKDIDLIEVSVVTHPMQPLARVLAIQHEGE